MTWPSWHDGKTDEGPIARRYHVTGFPTVFVLDAKGVIRSKGVRGAGLDLAVETLLKEMKPQAAAGTGSP